jgi:hypothetical protein
MLNKNGNSRPVPGFFGEEVVDPAFRALQLPQYLLNVRRALFGAQPDNAGMNYQLWNYTTILDSTEFSFYVDALDPRITYRHNKSLVTYPFGPVVNANADALDFVGSPNLGGINGQLYASWQIERVTPSQYVFTNLQSGVIENHTVTFTDGISTLFGLPGYSGYKVRFLQDKITASTWVIDYIARPTSEMDPIKRIAAVGQLGDETISQVFPDREPYKTWRRMWELHAHAGYKATGVLLAVVYRTEDIRLGRNPVYATMENACCGT